MNVFGQPSGDGAGAGPRPPELPKGMIKKIVLGIVIVLLLLVGSDMFYTVQEQERAAVLTFGKYTTETRAGLHFKWPRPIQRVVIVPANITQYLHIGYRVQNGQDVPLDDEALMITGDENIVYADAVVEWRVADLQHFLFNIDRNHVEDFIRNSASAAIRSVIGSVSLDYAITEGKTEIQGLVREELIRLNDYYQTGIQILDIKFQDIEPPGGEVAQAFREVTSAREERNTKINNANRYSNERIPVARGEAQALIEAAEAEKQRRILNAQGDVAQFNALYTEYLANKKVTTTRLILETLEQILPNAQIFITDGSGDTVQYLPLNELMRQQNRSQQSQQGGSEQ